MKHSLYLRNFIATALIVLISFALLGGLALTWSYRRTMSGKRDAMRSTLQETSRFVMTQHLFYGMDLSDLDLNMWLVITSGVSGFDLLVTDSDGVVCACSDRDFQNLGRIVPESVIQLAASGDGEIILSTLGHIYPDRRQIAYAPLGMRANGDSDIFGYLFVSSDLASFREEWRQFSSVFTLIALNVMVLAFVISFVATKKQAEPLNEMASAAHRFARGDFSMRVRNSGRIDEIGELTLAFNTMADSLENSEMLRREFIANLSHEMKTPMTVITGFVDGIIDKTIPQEKQEQYLSIISSETHRLSRLIKSMLDMSKLQSADDGAVLEGAFDITEVARLALLSLGTKIDEKCLDVEAGLPEEAIMTRGDKDSITQVVYNLVDNAIKFSTPGGVITLELWKQGQQAYVSIENHGETIPQDELPHIFDRFYKADKARSANREGIGLGLYIVKMILDKHNEDIFITSRNGATKFVFTLTIAKHD